MATHHIWGRMQTGAVSQRQTNTYLPISYSLQLENATKQHLPLLWLKTWGLMLPARCWKRPLQHSKCRVIVHGSSLPMANKYLFADLLFFTNGEGDEATSSSFIIRYVAIEASSASLEVLIGSLLPACGTTKEATFPTVINLLIAVGSLFFCANGERETLLSGVLIGAYNTLL